MRKYFFIVFFIVNHALAQKDNYQVFGSTEETAFIFTGDVYRLPDHTYKLPKSYKELEKLGKLYTDELNIYPRNFTHGFPGLSDIYEWFSIVYTGKFYLKEQEFFYFRLTSDDGSRLYIDGDLIIDHDGQHSPIPKFGKVQLEKGIHDIKVEYFQGPKQKIALQLAYAKSMNQPFEAFNIAKYKLVVEVEKEEKIVLEIDNSVLFDFDSYQLKEEAKVILAEINDMYFKDIKGIVIIEGHTDDSGSDAYNLKLSENRAKSVYNYFTISCSLDSAKVEFIGKGEDSPKYANTSEENRAKNRRVEIVLPAE